MLANENRFLVLFMFRSFSFSFFHSFSVRIANKDSSYSRFQISLKISNSMGVLDFSWGTHGKARGLPDAPQSAKMRPKAGFCVIFASSFSTSHFTSNFERIFIDFLSFEILQIVLPSRREPNFYKFEVFLHGVVFH